MKGLAGSITSIQSGDESDIVLIELAVSRQASSVDFATIYIPAVQL